MANDLNDITDPFTDSLRYYTSFDRNRLIDIAKSEEAIKLTMEAMRNQVFESTSFKISKWARFRLYFAKSHFGVDTEGDIKTITEMKMLGDKMYITHIWYYRNDRLIKEEKL